ncbi:2-dehydropantoate 2-reductase [Paenibacillus curdlanolyticus YK9]|uniref:2-dehydropantoate 2-reductase n=1 Tax=Paenibacillus curdlanolyticus YK9 TaxID=717606 RepID=E0I3E2_9BACL|nr:2-dehydropantoate 2-reductase [Paenibacillus curdlanolyticus]EFM12806.1 2-dehydropantoate 2-reductase [Paenibacillus curdlanolyticus YK9]
MHVSIVGGGAIGLLYGARLAMAAYDVAIWTRTGRQAELLNEEGIEFVARDRLAVVPVAAYAVADGAQQDNYALSHDRSVVFVTVKQPQLTDALVDHVASITRSGDFVIGMQNGIGHMDRLMRALPGRVVLAGVTTEGALRHHPRTVEFTGEGQLHVGSIAPSHPSIRDESTQEVEKVRESGQKMLMDMLAKAGITAILSNDMSNRIYQKLLINAVINPLTAIFDLSNGMLPAHAARRALMRALHEETFTALNAAGYQEEGSEESWERLLQVCERTASNISSMLADVRRGSMTEVDWINGGVCEVAARYGQAAPLNAAAVSLVKALMK